MQIRIVFQATQQLPSIRPMPLTTHCIQSFPFALLKLPDFGDEQWGTRTKKNPDKNKNKSRSSSLEGGFV